MIAWSDSCQQVEGVPPSIGTAGADRGNSIEEVSSKVDGVVTSSV
jgi:hypothetical protein